MDEKDLRQRVKALVVSSNEILSDREESVVGELLYEAQNTLSSIEAGIKSLEARREEQVEWIAQLRASVSSRKRVPPEILGNIFQFCADKESNIITIPLSQFSPSATLSQVCSQWRQVALAEPCLWNAIAVDHPSEVDPDTLEVLLSRAGNTITLFLLLVHTPPPVLNVLQKHSDKFQCVTLIFDPAEETKYLDIPFERLTALQRLQLYMDDDCEDGIDLYRATCAFENSPNLQRFELITHWVYLDRGKTAPLLVSWLNLEHLVIYCYINLHEFLHILAHCTRLVTCDASLNSDHDPVASLPVTLTNLISLTLTTYGHNLNEVLEFLTTPSLQILKTKNTSIELKTLDIFIRQSMCDLQTVEVVISNFPSRNIRPLLLAIPTVISLTIMVRDGIIDPILRCIATGVLLPNVEVLEFCVSSCEAVRALVSNRCGPSTDGSKKVIQRLTAWVQENDVTREWEEFQASLPEDGPVQIKFGQSDVYI